ncbi:MAG: CBS domain-containing protein [Alphaproteobacteria bacterium]|nr:CBS domain-containing protein [Alphaproteobacteria bacterium]
MATAADVMHAPAPAVAPSMEVRDLHAWLSERDLDGACVVEADELLGVVTSMDLVYQERRIHLPSFFVFLDAVIPLGDPQRTYQEVLKVAGHTVADICTRDVISVGPDAPVAEVAALMVRKHLSVVPVVDDGRLVGMITKDDVLRAHFG